MRQTSIAFLAIGMMLLTAADAVAAEQTVCPVLEGNPIDKQIFVDYQGKRVYFCCASCKTTFLNDAEKYLVRLPQFSKPVTHQEGAHADHQQLNGHFSAASLIVPLGISTLILMLTTALAGLLMKKNRGLLFPWHRRLGTLTVLVAISHVVCVLVAH